VIIANENPFSIYIISIIPRALLLVSSYVRSVQADSPQGLGQLALPILHLPVQARYAQGRYPPNWASLFLTRRLPAPVPVGAGAVVPVPVPVPTGMMLVVAVGLVVVTDRVGKAVVVVGCVVACVKKSKKGSALATVRRTARERIRAGTSMIVTLGPLDKESAWAEDGILIGKQRLGGLIKITPMD
jgi:hypothetical protein